MQTELLALCERCNGRLDDVILHILECHASGNACMYCEHTGSCEESGSTASCARGLADYFRRMED